MRNADAEGFLKKALVPANETRERLMSFVAHEIRNPLAGALWSAEMLARRSLGDPRNDRLAQLAARSTARLRGLLEDLFLLERIPIRLNKTRTDLRAAVAAAMAPHELEPKGVAASLESVTEVQVNVDTLMLDRLLHACLRRLVHIAPPGPVTIRLELDGEVPVLWLSRPGVSVETVDPPLLTTGGSEGTGTTFTLLVARAIAQRCDIGLSTEATADGAAIRLTFPRS